MFIDKLIHRRLASVLRPWLRQEPELELKLGFLVSRGVAKNLFFDTSALNLQLFDESSRWYFKDITVEQLSLRVSYWSRPTFIIEVRGFHLTLSLRELKEERGRRPTSKTMDVDLEDRKKVLSEIDPEGSALHEVMERLFDSSSSGNWKTSLLNLILKHCQLQMHDINLQVRFPNSDDSLSCFSKVEELNMESLYIDQGCFLWRFISLIFSPSKESCFRLDIRCLDIGLKSKDHISQPVRVVDLLTHIKLKDLRLEDLSLSSPELIFSISPVDVAVIVAFYTLSSDGTIFITRGRQLWNLAARRVRSLMYTSRLPLHKLFTTICLWLCCINAYEKLLLLVGYPLENNLKMSAVKMSQDDRYSVSFKNQFKMVSEIEKKLPAEAVVRARGIARYKVVFSAGQVKNNSSDLLVNGYNRFFRRILVLLGIVWSVICRIFDSFINLLLHVFLDYILKSDGPLDVSEDSSAQSSFSVSFGVISVTISPEVEDPGVNVGSLVLNLLSFHVILNGLFLTYTQNICEQCLSFSCGNLKVVSLSPDEDGSTNMNNYAKGHRKEEVGNLKNIIWTEPAQNFCFAEKSRPTTTDETEGSSVSFLWDILSEMRLNWEISCTKFEGSMAQHLENPWILCEIKESVTDQSLKNLSSGFWRCSLMVGKLSLCLDYSLILSTATVLRQMQRAIDWTRCTGRENVTSHVLTCEVSPVIGWDGRFKSYVSKMEKAVLKMIPQKHIQIAIHIAGPLVQISLRNNGFFHGYANESHIGQQDDLCLVVDVCDIELAAWPTLGSDFLAPSERQRLTDIKSEFHRLNDSQITGFPQSNNENYTCRHRISLGGYMKIHGLKAYLSDQTASQQNQNIVLNPIIMKLSSLREDVHSFVTSNVAISVALHGTAIGLTVLLFMDELLNLVKELGGLFYAVSYGVTSFDSFLSFQQLMKHKISCASSERDVAFVTRRKAAPLLFGKSVFAVNGTFDLRSIDILLNNSRERSDVENPAMKFDAVDGKIVPRPSLPKYGILISLQQKSLNFSCNEEEVEIIADLSEICSAIFGDQSDIWKTPGEFQLRDILHSPSCLYEASLSHCEFALRLASQNTLPSGSLSYSFDDSSAGSNVMSMEEGSSAIDTGRLNDQHFNFFQRLGFAPASGHWLLISIAIAEIYMVGSLVKKILVGSEKSKKLQFTLCVGREFQTIANQIQGGSVSLETTTLEMFVECFISYLHCIKHLLNVVPSKKDHISTESDEDMAIRDSHPGQGEQNGLQQITWQQLESLTIDFSEFSLLLVAGDGSGRLMEFQFGADFHLSLELKNMKKRFLFDLSCLSILSRFLEETGEQQNCDTKIPHFSSVASGNLSSPHVQDTAIAFQNAGGNHFNQNDASCSSPCISKDENVVHDFTSAVLHSNHQNYILKQLGASMSVERPARKEGVGSLLTSHVWSGCGSITGFDVTLSISEIQMLLSTVESLSGLFRNQTSGVVERRQLSSSQESERSLDEAVPDGAVIAIQDVHQHLYMTVEGIENKYSLVGAIHYSLVGEKALFRVKYQNRKRWKSSTVWFSLISLYAKSDSGEPLRLNYHPGSGFLDISSTNDGGWALWKKVSCEPESFEGDVELESYNFRARDTFYLVNKKIDRSIAFVDGVPEFVTKPGNPFKWKVFHDFSPSHDVVLLDHCSGEASSSNVQHNSHVNQGKASEQTADLPRIDIKIDKIMLTIVHELADTKEKFPLLQASIRTVEFIVQILLSKARVMSTLIFVLYYFDAQNNLWREFIHPVEICIFCRSSFLIQGLEIGVARVPVHFYSRMKQLDVSITELSLDMLLYVIGKLNLAGPFAVKTSVIFSNCCKVENQSGLDLVCHFYDNQDVSITRKQCSTVVFRHTLVDQPPEASHVSIQLAEQGAYLTSPICFSLLSPRAVAWRTRIMSLQDSKSYPGPFVVVDIPGRKEDGMSIVVSPLLRIHNETKFSLELRFRRPQQNADQSASVLLKSGDIIDDSVAAFDAKSSHGGLKKALMSVTVGNFLLSFRPIIVEDLRSTEKSLLGEWSDDIKGGKPVVISGLFDKLSYKVRRAFYVDSMRCSFSTARCSFKYDHGQMSDLHFLIRSIIRDIPVIQPENYGDVPGNRESPVALQQQKEIFLLPPVRVLNLLQEEIHVLLTDRDPCAAIVSKNIANQATIPCGSTVDFYVNPATIYFLVTLTAYNSSCKPVDTGHSLKKLERKKNEVHYVDIDLVFGAKYFASLRLSRGLQGTLEASIFTSYTLKNDTDLSLFCFAPNQKPLSRGEAEKLDFRIPPEFGSFLPPKSTKSWFMKYNKVQLKLLEEKAKEVLLDLDTLSGLTEIGLEVEERSGVKYIAKLGVSLGPFFSEENVSSQLVSIVPRYVLVNESEEAVTVRQCYLEDDMAGLFTISSKQKMALMMQSGISKRKEIIIFDKFVRKHRNAYDDSLMYIQFRLNGDGWGWSGPVCVASLGRFFLKFRRSSHFPLQQSNQVNAHGNNSTEFAAVHVVEESSTLVLLFQKPSDVNLPYRIENGLHQNFITYYQKGSLEPENLGCGSAVDYVWDDMTLPHRLVVQINGMNLLREINLDKVRSWKPFYKVSHQRGLRFHLPLDKNLRETEKASFGESISMQMVNVGYEVFANGPTRVLRFCEFRDRHKQDISFHLSGKIRFRISHFSITLLEHSKKEVDASESSGFTPLIVTRLGNINLDSVLTDKYSHNKISVQSLSVDQKWVGAPFAAMLRRHHSDYGNTNDNILQVVAVLVSSSSNVKQVKYLSVILQPVDLNLDEETLMRLVTFWRTSLSDSNTQRQQYYFDHFEIHPIKIIASFLPGDSYSSYSSSQEMLRSLIHSVIKIPAVKRMSVELNGVLVTHALISIRELIIKCAQHFSWYAMRAIYIAKGSPLLPPAFASVFDDLASSALDVFFDPSSILVNLPGLTAGTFKLISKCIDGKGFFGTKRYLGDLGKTMKTAGSNMLYAAVTEISDSVLKGAEASGFNGMVIGFHQGILKLAMEPSLLGTAFIEGGPDRKIILDHDPGVDELYIEGYLQAMLDTLYKQEYLRVRVVDNQVILKNLPPNSSLVEEIMDRVKGFLVSKALLKGDPSTSQPLRHLRGDSEWKIGPTVLTLCEHLFVSFAIRFLRKQADKLMAKFKWKGNLRGDDHINSSASTHPGQKGKLFCKWGIAKFVFSGIVAYIDGRLCRGIPNPVARRIVSGFMLSFLDKNDNE